MSLQLWPADEFEFPFPGSLTSTFPADGAALSEAVAFAFYRPVSLSSIRPTGGAEPGALVTLAGQTLNPQPSTLNHKP